MAIAMSVHREQVKEFHRVFGQPIAERPTVPSDERVRLRLRLIAEEFVELMFAAGYGEEFFGSIKEAMEDFDEGIKNLRIRVDLPAFADALADLDYVIEGARLEFGIDGEKIADVVHQANLDKRHMIGGSPKVVRREDGKVLKPADWTPPDIAGELRRQGWKE